MKIRIVSIDFHRASITMELHPAFLHGMTDRLPAFIAMCRNRGLGDIQVACRPGVSRLHMVMLRELCTRHSVQLDVCTLDAFDEVLPDTLASTCELVEENGDAHCKAIEYHLSLADTAHAVERAATAALLIGAAADLPEATRGHLRLFIYELVINSIEHGDFDAAPQIHADARLASDGIRLSYRDNARMFVTGNHNFLNVEQKIQDGDRRGLGLYMLNRMASSLEYRRLGEWNVTTATLMASDDGNNNERWVPMETITVEVIPCDLPGMVILKPTGTVDSSSTQVLESQMDRLMDQSVTTIIIDFGAVDFISSAGVGIFLGSVSKLRAAGGDLLFMNVPRQIEDVFDIINLRSYFRTIKDPAELQPAAGTPE